MISQIQINTSCSSCGGDTGTNWKTLCRSCWKNQDPEKIREHRQAKLDRKIERLRKSADSRDITARVKTEDFREKSKDLAWVTQPNINSSGGRAFRNQREKTLAKYDAGMRLHIEADKLRDKAEWLEQSGVAVKGDAERKRQAEREELDKVVHVGSKVYDFCFREGVVTKVNKKTYTIKFNSGGHFTREKTFIKPL